MYLILVAILDGAPGVTLAGLIHNLVPVSLGNVVSGTMIVAVCTWLTLRFRGGRSRITAGAAEGSRTR
jgi:formate/nitrite transporter FocA (FNT family)